MFSFDINNYLDNMARTPKQEYEQLNQATINDQWDNTTQLYTIKEQKALPFVDEYIEYEAWVDTVSDDLINYSKVYSDFVKILFKDINHKQNYKGQYYKMSLDNETEEYYICYDRINRLTQVSDFKCVRCNNFLTWIDNFGNIIKMPCYLGTDISSTNNLISKDGIVPNARMIVLVQANEFTKSIVKNQRFMFQNSTAFKVEEVNNYMQEQGTNGEVTCVKIYISYSSILPTDNVELNICDYYKNNYTIEIDQGNISQIKGFKGELTATVKNCGNVVNVPIEWITELNDVISIDKNGRYEVIGEPNSFVSITCRLVDNPNITNTITLTVVDSPILDKKIVVNPNDISSIKENKYIDFDCNVYIDGEMQPDKVICVGSNVDEEIYDIEKIDVNKYRLTSKGHSKEPLILTFSAVGCSDVVMFIKMYGVI